MKLYMVHLWNFNVKEREDQLILVAAYSEEEAETKALNSSYLDCAEAEEINEIDGYRVIFEKIEKGE